MKKTLVIILNYNTPEITDKLFETLKPHEGHFYDLHVIDNGSDEGKGSKYTTIQEKANRFFGGGLNRAFKYFLDNKKKYDSLLFMNSDLVVFGPSYVKTLRQALFSNPGYKIISPALIGDWNGQPPLQMHKHMNSWGATEIREVKYIDFETPMFHEDFILEVKAYDDDLMYGIGQDHISGMICEEHGWKVGVIDWISAFHMWAYTIRSGNAKLNLNTYATVSNEALRDYANKVGITEKLSKSFGWGADYSWDK